MKTFRTIARTPPLIVAASIARVLDRRKALVAPAGKNDWHKDELCAVSKFTWRTMRFGPAAKPQGGVTNQVLCNG